MTLALAFKNTTSDYSGTGAGLAGRLTSAQADNNNWLIKQAIETLQAATGKTISSCAATGNQLTITYTDATTDTVTLPSATWTWRGEFAAVSYAANDLFSYYGTIYLVLIAHTGSIPLDAGLQSGGNNVYQKVLDFPAIPIKTVTAATYDPILSDANSYIRFTNGSGCGVTIPSNAEIAFPVGTELHLHDANDDTSGTGMLTIEAATGTVLNIPVGYTGLTATQHGTIGLKKVATDEWDVFGLLTIATA